MNFKYKANFEAKATLKKGNYSKAKKDSKIFAKASLENLSALLPSDEIIKDNYDLLYTAFNAAVVNLINENGHGIGTDAALAVTKYFVNRHLNLEHDRYSIVGHIINYGFSSFGENEILEESSISGNQPFNICLGGIVYKHVREYVSELLKESSDEDSYMFEEISTSWEIGFNEYDIVLGSKKIADAKIISDQKEIEKYSQYLVMEGGEGFLPDGTPVYCLIKGEARPLGCAFTGNPAAAVRGIITKDAESLEKDDQEEEAKAAVLSKIEELNNKIEKIIKINSHSEEKPVNINNMKIEKIEDITPDAMKVVEASVIRDFVKTKLEKDSQEYLEKVKEANEAKTTLEQNLSAASEKVVQLEKDLKAANDKAQLLETEVASKAKQEVFNTRMDEISSLYDLNEKQSQVVASQIKDLDDSGFVSWSANFELFNKKKEPKSQEELLREAQASNSNLPNSSFVSKDKTELQEMLGNFKNLFNSDKQ